MPSETVIDGGRSATNALETVALGTAAGAAALLEPPPGRRWEPLLGSLPDYLCTNLWPGDQLMIPSAYDRRATILESWHPSRTSRCRPMLGVL